MKKAWRGKLNWQAIYTSCSRVQPTQRICMQNLGCKVAWTYIGLARKTKDMIYSQMLYELLRNYVLQKVCNLFKTFYTYFRFELIINLRILWGYIYIQGESVFTSVRVKRINSFVLRNSQIKFLSTINCNSRRRYNIQEGDSFRSLPWFI